MKYLLNSKFALRSYNNSKYVLLVHNTGDTISVSKEKFDILLKCDGKQSVERSSVLEKMLQDKWIIPYEEGKTLTSWQSHKFCDNPFFSTMSVRITGKCNFNCKHCFNAVDLNRDFSEWTMPEFEQLVKQSKECGANSFIFTGGEPMLSPHFLDMVRIVHDNDMFVSEILTNAHFMTQETLDELKKINPQTTLTISFDCLGHHDWMRGMEGAEKKAIKNIKMCVDSGFNVYLGTQINSVTEDSLLATADFFDNMGVQACRMIRTTETPRWAKYCGDTLLSLEQYYDICIEFLKQYYMKPRKMVINLWGLGIFYSKFKSYRCDAIRCSVDEYSDYLPVCHNICRKAAISSNGNLYPCHQMSGLLDSYGYKCPNVKEIGLQAALNATVNLDFIHMTAKDIVDNNKKCRECSHFKQCFGGCRLYALMEEKNLYGSDPCRCSFFKGNYETKLEAVLPGWRNMHKSEDASYKDEDYLKRFF